jgi:hypothetical protein
VLLVSCSESENEVFGACGLIHLGNQILNLICEFLKWFLVVILSKNSLYCGFEITYSTNVVYFLNNKKAAEVIVSVLVCFALMDLA